MRLFLAVDPIAEVRAALGAAIARAREGAPDARWMKEADIHVTLKYLGDVSRATSPEAIADAVRGVAARHAPLTLRAAGVGTFGGEHPKVLWIGVRGDTDALCALQRDIEGVVEPLGFAREERAFTPHFTLALARGEAGDPALAACVPPLATADFGASRVTEIVLYRSRVSFFGERYAPIARIALGRS